MNITFVLIFFIPVNMNVMREHTSKKLKTNGYSG